MADRQTTFGIRLKADGSGFVGEVKAAGDQVRQFGEEAKKAAKESEDASRQSIASASRWGAAVGAAAVAAGAAIAYAVKQQIDAMAELAINSQRLQTTVEELSQLDYVARLNNVSSQALARSFRELNKDAFEAARGNQAAAQQFDAVGIALRDGTGQLKDAKTLFLEMADVVASIENPTIKAAVATRFFGLRAEELLPVLNKGSAGIREMYGEAEQFGAVVGGDAAQAANELNDNITRLKITVEAWARTIASEVVPALNNMVEVLLHAKQSGQGFMTGAISALKDAGRPAEDLKREINDLNRELLDLEENASSAGNRLAQLVIPGFKQGLAVEISTKSQQLNEKALALAVAEQNAARADAAREQQRLSDRAALSRLEPGRGASYEDIVAERLNKPARAGRARTERDRGADLESQISQSIALLNAEEEAGRKLTQSERLRIKIEQDLADGKLTLTTRQMIAIDQGLEEWRVTELASDAKREEARLLQEMARERERAIAAAEQEAASLQRQVDLFGMSRAEILDYEAAELEATAAIQRAAGAIDEETAATERQARAKRAAAASARELAREEANRYLDDQLIALEDEIRLIGASNAERVKAILLRKLERDGIEATAEELEKINRIAADVTIHDEMQRTQRAIDDAASAAARFGEELVLNFTDAASAVKQLEQDLLRIGTRALVTEPLEQWFKSLLGTVSKGGSSGGGNFLDIFGNAFIKLFGMHDGGIVGTDASFTGVAPAAAFRGARRYHGGGLPGFGAGEVPAILKVGEEVLTRDDPRHRFNGGAGGVFAPTININMPAGAQVTRKTLNQAAADAFRLSRQVAARGF